jgi:hypothetical protein
MNYRVYLTLSLVALGAIAHAADKTSQHSLLKSSVTSASELSNQFQQIAFPGKIRLRASAICQDLGVCEEVTYYDPPDTIHRVAPGADNLKAVKQAAEESFSSQQLEIQSILKNSWIQCPYSQVRTFFKNIYLDPAAPPPTDCYLNKFTADGFLDPETLKQTDIAALDSAYSDLISGKQSAALFSSVALTLPKAFPHLPELLSRARASQSAAAIQALQDVIAKALLLTLDSMVPVSSSANATYPFLDNLVPDHSLLSVNDLYQKLSQIKQWPVTMDLSPEFRRNLGGIYSDKTSSSDSARWKVKGFYAQTGNQVVIDLANDFYENAFVYYHELWHVAWAHSSEGQKQTSTIVSLLKDPANDASTLRKSILNALSTNEFLAIDQQIRLFHAMGFQAQDWDNSQISSTLAWHDSYFGREAYQLLTIRSKDRGDDFFENSDRNGQVSYGLIESVYETGKGIVAKSKYKTQDQKINADLDSKYWAQQIETHSQLFESAYFGENLGLSKTIQPVTPDNLIQSVIVPDVPVLSCSDIDRVEKAMGQEWKFGFPFDYTVSDPENCPDKAPGGPNHPSTEGSHAAMAGTFPSLEGPAIVPTDPLKSK